jgi:hypothetical protein
MAYTFQQLANALDSCSSFWAKKSKDEEGNVIYLLMDGCGEQHGEAFEELIDLQDYITNNQDCFDYLYRHN